MTRREAVVHPRHYNSHPSGLECFEVVERMQFCMGNAVKYLWRADHKDSKIEDIKKAQFYLTRALEEPSINIVGTGDRTITAHAEKVSAERDASGINSCIADLCYAQSTGNPQYVLRVERSLAAFLTGANL